MTKDKIQTYTLRISQANRSEMVVILFDLFDEYITDAMTAYSEDNHEAFRENVGYANKVVTDLMNALNMSYKEAASLLEIYGFVSRHISLAVIKRDVTNLAQAKSLMDRLKAVFEEGAKQNTDGPMMKNSETVFAGLTYGRRAVMDSLTTEVNRGFKV